MPRFNRFAFYPTGSETAEGSDFEALIIGLQQSQLRAADDLIDELSLVLEEMVVDDERVFALINGDIEVAAIRVRGSRPAVFCAIRDGLMAVFGGLDRFTWLERERWLRRQAAQIAGAFGEALEEITTP